MEYPLLLFLGGKVVTNDYNLNKVAQVQGVEVLNINELANAIKPVAIPGEEMIVQVVKEGKEHSLSAILPSIITLVSNTFGGIPFTSFLAFFI